MSCLKNSCQTVVLKCGDIWIALCGAVVALMMASSGCGGAIEVNGGQPPSAVDERSVAAEPGTLTASDGNGSAAIPGTIERESKSATPSECKVNTVKVLPTRRLSHVEYNRSIAALFPDIDVPVQSFAADLRIHGFENNATAMNASPVLVEQYADAASRVAEVAAAKLDKVLPCTPDGDDMPCATAFISDFGLRAFRRPLRAEEQARFEDFFRAQMGEIGFEAAVELTLQAFLQAPQFIYRLELGEEAEREGEVVALDDFAMASRLSFLLWQRMPDAELFAAAKRGELHTADQIASQARRMLKDPAASAAWVDFHRQWLDFDRLLTEDKDAGMFPDWNEPLRAAMREESDRFVAHVFTEGSGSVAELLTSNVSFVNEPLAALYGVDGADEGWKQVTLPKERAGLLTRGTFLASRAHATNGSPPLRGVAVLDQLLCAKPPAPPPNVDTSLPSNDDAMPLTNRDLFESRTSKQECQGCHQSINGIGYGFEAFDAIGAYRQQDRGQPVDASGDVMGTSDANGPYDGAVELSQKLADSRQVEQCAVKNWFRYAMAREEASNDSCKIDALYTALDQSGGDVRELLVALATSFEFTHRPAVSVQ